MPRMRRNGQPWVHNFETGWYLPGIEDPEVVAAELDPAEEAAKPTTAELYALLTSLSEKQKLKVLK